MALIVTRKAAKVLAKSLGDCLHYLREDLGHDSCGVVGEQDGEPLPRRYIYSGNDGGRVNLKRGLKYSVEYFSTTRHFNEAILDM